MTKPLVIDGSHGEGGGQILRSSLASSMLTGTPFILENIRANRRRPGLHRQHLTCVRAAAAVCRAEVEGDALHSTRLVFRPGPITHGTYQFAVGTAGSATLVLQTVLPALLKADGPSELTIEGGTHNGMAPPFEFLDETYLATLRRFGVQVASTLMRPGFYPAGGGSFRVRIQPSALRRFEILERGDLVDLQVTALLSKLPRHIAERELKVLGQALDLDSDALHVEEVSHALGPGNAVLARVVCEHITTVFSAVGQKGVPAERVARSLAREVIDYLDSGAAVDCHLADQLLLPMAVFDGGTFQTQPPTLHTRTNLDVLGLFWSVEPTLTESAPGLWLVSL